MKDYYKLLGVGRNVSKEEIKRAYRRLAHQYHPDKNGGDETRFKEINEAYQVLGDEKKKAQYDQFGSTFSFQDGSAPGGGFSGFQGFDFGGFSAKAGGVDFNDIFSQFFSGTSGTSAKTRSRGEDISIDVLISLEEAYEGVEREINLKKYVQCDRCRGNLSEPGTKLKICAACNGRGEIRKEQRTIFGSFARIAGCEECAGIGKIPEKKCSHCRGIGRIRGIDHVTIKIPAGIDSADTVPFLGKGEASRAGVAGDLYVQVHIKQHPHFKRNGNDIYSEKRISISQAVLGGSLTVETLGGNCQIKIPSGTQSQDVIKLQGKGMPDLRRGGIGDHYATLVVETPKKLSKKVRDLFEELRKEGI